MKYQILGVGEKIKKGDEMCFDGNKWHKIDNSGYSCLINDTIKPGFQFLYRRPLKDNGHPHTKVFK